MHVRAEVSAEDKAALDQLFEQIQPVRVIKADISVLLISDSEFNDLSEKWKRGAAQLAKSKKCARFDALIWKFAKGSSEEFLVAKAQMITESSCNPDALGASKDSGLFQVLPDTCAKEMKVEGDLLKPETNAKCRFGYWNKLLRDYGAETLTERLIAYNRGPGGAKKVSKKESEEYARKVQFALEQLLK